MAGTLLPAERQELLELSRQADTALLTDAIARQIMDHPAADLQPILPAEAKAAVASIISLDKQLASSPEQPAPASPRSKHRVPFFKTAWFRYAAAVLAIVAGIGFLSQVYNKQQRINGPAIAVTSAGNDISPGGNKAILTLADGSRITLDSAADGDLASQGNTKILKLQAGSLAYKIDGSSSSGAAVLYNTISTPKGGQYQVSLPDGSKAWLNAASSIKFPTAFGKDRTIEITGELFLEIAPDHNRPFVVSTRGTTIQVLGTSFNINAYSDEPAVTATVSEGRVKVTSNRKSDASAMPGPDAAEIIVTAGGQAVVTDSKTTLNRQANLEQAMAWKNGRFYFDHSALPDVMRQLQRWYDMDVVYEKGVPEMYFGGKMSRNANLSQILKVLETARVHFRLDDGRKLIVLP